MTHDHDPCTVHLLDRIEATAHRLVAGVAGLDEADLRRPVVPSGWTPLGLLGHVRDSSFFWLHHVLLGHPMAFDETDDRWDDDPTDSAAEVVDSLVGTVSAACRATRHLASDAAPGWWPEGAWGGYRQDTVRGVLVHLLVDNTAHTGHLDIARELVDGGVWDFGEGRVTVPPTQRVG